MVVSWSADLSPNSVGGIFHLMEGEGSFTSGEVRPSEFVTLCHFMPGEYEYSVIRKYSPSSPIGGTAKSTGKISVTE
jgi:hypothetical protein